MTIHTTTADMTEPEIIEDDDMARRINPRQMIRMKQAEAGGIVAKTIVAKAHRIDDGMWGAQFAVPGTMIDFCRHPNGDIQFFDEPYLAEIEAMRAAISLFNQPREHLMKFGNNRMANSDTAGGVRPAKMSPAEMSESMRAANLDTGDLVFLLDKPAKRILDWSNNGDIPHEVRLLLRTWAKHDDTVDLAFEITNSAIEEAARTKGP